MIQWNRVTWYSKLLAILLLIGVFFIGVYFGTRQSEIADLFPREEGVVCTADAKSCPDGSFVGRTGPNCTFAACPSFDGLTGNDAGAPDIPGDFVPQ